MVSFTARYRLVYATRRLAVVAGLEAAIADAAALVFAWRHQGRCQSSVVPQQGSPRTARPAGSASCAPRRRPPDVDRAADHDL